LRNIAQFIVFIINIPGMAKNLFRHREVVRILTWRDFQARFRGSAIGIIWSVIQPLLTMVIYTLVFSSFLQVRFGNSDSPYIFSVYLLCGLLPWTAFAEGLNMSTTLVRSNSNLVKRVVFPLEVLPIILTFGSIIQQLIGFALLIPMVYLVNGHLYWTILFMPVILLLQMMFITGLNWIWSSISIFLPDLRQFTALLTFMLMFLTPIMYPESIIPKRFQFLIHWNPMASIISMYRNIFMDGTLPPVSILLTISLVSLAIYMIGYAWFMLTKKAFADFI
jgi:ABC-type polysaccharide/polyol phosphate export permease